VRASFVKAGEREFWYEWRLTLGPGESAALLHFAVQRAPGDTAGAEAQARALADLSDPAAIEDLSAYERGLIVNFGGVPGAEPPPSGGFTGAVWWANAPTTPVQGARVAVQDPATDRLLGTARTSASGSFSFESLHPSQPQVWVTVSAPDDPQISVQYHYGFTGGMLFGWFYLPGPPAGAP
jgi:hypothetical protein